MDDDMDFDPSDLETYTNKRASELLSNALSRLGHEKLGYENYKQAFSELGKVFWVKPNTVKNDRDHLIPSTTTIERVGIKLKPSNPRSNE